MNQVLSCVLMILGLLIVGAVSAYCDEPPGKKRYPWESQEHNQWVQEQTTKRIFNGTMRDPFKQQRRKYVPDCGRPVKPIMYPNFITAQGPTKKVTDGEQQIDSVRTDRDSGRHSRGLRSAAVSRDRGAQGFNNPVVNNRWRPSRCP